MDKNCIGIKRDNEFRIVTKELYKQLGERYQHFNYTLPVKLIRKIIQNVMREYELYECSITYGKRGLKQYNDIQGIIKLKTNLLIRLVFGNKYIVFEQLHPSLYDESYIKLTADHIDKLKVDLEEGEELDIDYYTLYIDQHAWMIATKDLKELLNKIKHIKSMNIKQFNNLILNYVAASIEVNDDVEIVINYKNDKVINVSLENTEEYWE